MPSCQNITKKGIGHEGCLKVAIVYRVELIQLGICEQALIYEWFSLFAMYQTPSLQKKKKKRSSYHIKGSPGHILIEIYYKRIIGQQQAIGIRQWIIEHP